MHHRQDSLPTRSLHVVTRPRHPGLRPLSVAAQILITLASCAEPQLRGGLGPDPNEPVPLAVLVTPASTSVQPGATQAFAAQLVYSDSSSAAVTPAWSATGGTISGGGIYTAGSTAGTFLVIATDQQNGFSDTSTVTISPTAPTLTAIEVTPATASVPAGARRQFQATGRRSDNSTTTVSVSWSATGGTITGGGRYTAGTTTGSFRVIATQQGGSFADTSAVTVTAPVLSAVVLTPSTASLAAGATQQFSASGRMSDNSTSTVAVNYSATGGSITTGGLYTAGTTAGSYRVIATQQGGTLADTSTVTISGPAPTLVRVVLSPTSATIATGASQLFTRRRPDERQHQRGGAGDLCRHRRHHLHRRALHRGEQHRQLLGHRHPAGRDAGRYVGGYRNRLPPPATAG